MASQLRKLERSVVRHRDGGQAVHSYSEKRHDAILAWYNERGDRLKLPKRNDKKHGMPKRRSDGSIGRVGGVPGYLNWFSRIGEAFANFHKGNSPTLMLRSLGF